MFGMADPEILRNLFIRNPRRLTMDKKYYEDKITDAHNRRIKWLDRYRQAMKLGDTFTTSLALEGVKRWTAYEHYYNIRLKEVTAAN